MVVAAGLLMVRMPVAAGLPKVTVPLVLRPPTYFAPLPVALQVAMLNCCPSRVRKSAPTPMVKPCWVTPELRLNVVFVESPAGMRLRAVFVQKPEPSLPAASGS